jgi:hypothetical protein
MLWGCSPPEPVRIAYAGQWVWTAADQGPLAEARADRSVVAGVHVATVAWRDGAFTNTLALPPTVVAAPVAVVVRIDDSVHGAWDALGDDGVAAGLDDALGRVMALVRSRAVAPVEVQLDYDCPVRLLGRWGGALATLRSGALAGERVWVTSLVAHVADPGYGAALRAADGHLLQVFDTGDLVVDAARVGDLAVAAGLPYRLGLGAFERDGAAPTSHRAWFGVASVACRPPSCDTVWVFPAGRPYRDLLPPPPQTAP